MKTTVHFFMILLSFFSFMAKSKAATYYTAMAGSTLAGNSPTVSAGWTTDPTGVSGYGTAAILTSDTIVILNGGTATISAATTVGALTINSGGTLIHTTGTFIANGTFTWNGTLETNSGSGNFNANGNVVGTTAIHASTSTPNKRGVFFGGTSKTINLIQTAGVPDTAVGLMYMNTNHALAGNTTFLSPLGWSGNAALDLAGFNLSVTSIQGGTTNKTITGNSASTLQITGGIRASSFYMTSGSETLGSLLIDQTGAGASGSLATTINTNVQVNTNLSLLPAVVAAAPIPRDLTITGNLNLGSSAVVNVNGGTMNVSGTLAPSTATVNIDAGSVVLTGDQTSAIAPLVVAGKITVSGAALAAGKTISNTYNSGTGKTTILASASTTWNGLTWSNATGATASLEAIIEGVYSTGTNGGFNAKKLTVNSGSLTINSNTDVTVQNEVVNNAGANGIVVENNANLIQVLGTTNTNTGNIVVNRNSSSLLRLDYTLWSSPVAGQNLAAFSPLTSQSPNRFYTYDTVNNQYSNAFNPTLTSFAAGTGYLIRMPNTADAVTPTAYAGQFTGVPNNGDVPFTLSTAGGAYNLIGNPYPSAINLYTLQSNNSGIIGNTFYMWRKTNGAGTAYCTYVPASTTSGTYVSNGNAQSPVTFAGNIQPGQGFFVKALTTGPLVFKNAQRVSAASSFFKTKQAAVADKVWLNVTNTTGDFSQMAVTYFEGATQGVDAFDGKYINDSPFALTSNINNDEYTIQGRPAFDASDVVPLNFKTAAAGNYTIAIDHSEGVFATGQSVILTDAATGTETDLTTSAYTFTAATGIASSRFSLKYQKTLGVNKAVFNDNNVTVYKSKGTLYVNAGDAVIANIKVYDVQGRLMVELKNVKGTSANIANLKAANQVLVVKITSEENIAVTKKVVN